MNIYKIILFSFMTLGFPKIIYADIHVVNETESYGTGYINYSPCSSKSGKSGIIGPRSSGRNTLDVPQSVIDTFCFMSDCKAHVFATNNCGGKKIATADIDKKHGTIKQVQNLDSGNFNIVANGKLVTIYSTRKGLINWIKALF